MAKFTNNLTMAHAPPPIVSSSKSVPLPRSRSLVASAVNKEGVSYGTHCRVSQPLIQSQPTLNGLGSTMPDCNASCCYLLLCYQLLVCSLTALQLVSFLFWHLYLKLFLSNIGIHFRQFCRHLILTVYLCNYYNAASNLTSFLQRTGSA